MGYRWHFWSDWWGYAGGGLVDVERVPKATYDAFRDASRPRLLVGLQDASVVGAGDVVVPIVAVNDGAGEAWTGTTSWGVVEAVSAVFAPDVEGARIGLPVPPDPDARVAVPRDRGTVVAHGELAFDAAPAAATRVGDVAFPVEAGQARTLILRWTDVDLTDGVLHLHESPAQHARH